MKVTVTIVKALEQRPIQTKSGRFIYRQAYLLDGHGEYTGTISVFADAPMITVAPGDYVATLSRMESRDLNYQIVADKLDPVPSKGTAK